MQIVCNMQHIMQFACSMQKYKSFLLVTCIKQYLIKANRFSEFWFNEPNSTYPFTSLTKDSTLLVVATVSKSSVFGTPYTPTSTNLKNAMKITGCPTSNLETLRAYILKSTWLGTKILGAKCIICGYILFDNMTEKFQSKSGQ